jgi:hypothetical protein
VADVAIDLGDWKQHRQRLERFTRQEQQAILREAGELAGATFDSIVRTTLPPPVRKQRQAHHWTDRQRAWWWATMHEKALRRSQELPGWRAVYKEIDGRKTLVISGGYVRTGTLVKSLTYEVRQSGQVTDVIYGTNRDYAVYVIDRDRQAAYHKGNWKTLQAFAIEGTAQVRRAFEVGIQRGVARRLGG